MTTRTRELIDLDLIDDNPWQPRQGMDPDALDTLAENIRQLGLLQAPLLRPSAGGRFQAAFGHRRIAALRLLRQQGRGGSHVEMDVANPDYLSDARMALMALSENEARQDLSQIEVLRAHRKAIDETDLTVTSLAEELGIARPTLANNLRVLDLPDFLLEHVESGDLKINVAKEFLVLRSPTHEHTEDMREVLRRVVGFGYSPPDWRRKNVRKLISERVSYNEADWRPLGPPTKHTTQGGKREAGFDVGEFEFEFKDCLHTIPADDGRSENYRALENYDQSRLWTCEVKEWSRRQGRATREANQEKAGSGGGTSTGGAVPNGAGSSRFEQLLANDPVWKAMPAGREKPGRGGQLTEYEREQLGTRAELKHISNGSSTPFWKLVERGVMDSPHQWRGKSCGGKMPPWFPIKDCRTCIAGAAYAHSGRDRYPLDTPTLVCLNRACFDEKNVAGAAAYREKLEAQELRVARQERRASEWLERQLAALPEDAVQVLATALAVADPALQWEHPIDGRYDAQWSYETETLQTVREILGKAVSVNHDQYGRHRGTVLNLGAGHADVDSERVRELVARLMTYHLRSAGQLDSVSRGSPEAQPLAQVDDADDSHGTLAEAVAAVIEPAGDDEYLTFGNLKSFLPERWRNEHSRRWMPAIAPVAPDAYVKKVKIEGQARAAVFGVRLVAQEKMAVA